MKAAAFVVCFWVAVAALVGWIFVTQWIAPGPGGTLLALAPLFIGVSIFLAWVFEDMT